jgi:hypothetical protein
VALCVVINLFVALVVAYCLLPLEVVTSPFLPLPILGCAGCGLRLGIMDERK